MKREGLAVGEYYHVYNRGNDKKKIFTDERSWTRFLLLLFYFQSADSFKNLSRAVDQYVQHRMLHIEDSILERQSVELVAFTLMPNHFHLLLRETKDGGISKYMQRIQNSYTKYINTKHKTSGHLFQGPYQMVRVKNNEHLLHLSAYIHRNPREMREWRGKEHNYPWSSYQDYVHKNRWGRFLSREIIAQQFSSKKKYKHFLDTSPTKLFKEELAKYNVAP